MCVCVCVFFLSAATLLPLNRITLDVFRRQINDNDLFDMIIEELTREIEQMNSGTCTGILNN